MLSNSWCSSRVWGYAAGVAAAAAAAKAAGSKAPAQKVAPKKARLVCYGASARSGGLLCETLPNVCRQLLTRLWLVPAGACAAAACGVARPGAAAQGAVVRAGYQSVPVAHAEHVPHSPLPLVVFCC